jgi:hypothetical protein
MPVIPAILEADIGKITVSDQPRQKVKRPNVNKQARYGSVHV